MPTLARWMGLLLALPFIPVAYAVSLLRTASAGRRAAQPAATTAADLAWLAMGIVQREREARGLEPLECSRIDISYGEGFDELRIQFGAETLSDGAAEGLQLMGQLANFNLAPRIERTISTAQMQSRMQALKRMR
jgi:hypothetical protein